MKKKQVNNLEDLLQPMIKVVEILANGKTNDIRYISNIELNQFLKDNRIVRDTELHEKLNFFLCVSANSAFDKIMIKKLEKFIDSCKDNQYVKYIGTTRRDDPKQEAEDNEAQVIHKGKLPN